MPDDASTLGEMIRRQRELQALSLRQLADLTGISNPYLSQIERGLREPSQRVLAAIADTLELSADVLQRERGRTEAEPEAEPAEPDESPVAAAIRADPRLTRRQRQALLEVYAAFIATKDS